MKKVKFSALEFVTITRNKSIVLTNCEDASTIYASKRVWDILRNKHAQDKDLVVDVIDHKHLGQTMSWLATLLTM
jgi:hypothetical protein